MVSDMDDGYIPDTVTKSVDTHIVTMRELRKIKVLPDEKRDHALQAGLSEESLVLITTTIEPIEGSPTEWLRQKMREPQDHADLRHEDSYTGEKPTEPPAPQELSPELLKYRNDCRKYQCTDCRKPIGGADIYRGYHAIYCHDCWVKRGSPNKYEPEPDPIREVWEQYKDVLGMSMVMSTLYQDSMWNAICKYAHQHGWDQAEADKADKKQEG